MGDFEWPEFRRWYELTMEEQRIHAEEDEHDHDRLLDAVADEQGPLEKAMHARDPQSLQQLAMLAVIDLCRANKRLDADIPSQRHLAFGIMDSEARMVESVLKLALAQNLLPGVVIHGAAA